MAMSQNAEEIQSEFCLRSIGLDILRYKNKFILMLKFDKAGEKSSNIHRIHHIEILKLRAFDFYLLSLIKK